MFHSFCCHCLRKTNRICNSWCFFKLNNGKLVCECMFVSGYVLHRLISKRNPVTPNFCKPSGHIGNHLAGQEKSHERGEKTHWIILSALGWHLAENFNGTEPKASLEQTSHFYLTVVVIAPVITANYAELWVNLFFLIRKRKPSQQTFAKIFRGIIN